MVESVHTRQPLLLTGKQVGSGKSARPGGPQVMQSELELAIDPTHGLYIASLRVGELVAYFDPTPLVKIGLWNTVTDKSIMLVGPTDVMYTVNTFETTGVITVECFPILYLGFIVTVTFTPIVDGFRVTASVTHAGPTYGVEWFEIPRLGCKPDSGNVANAWIAHGLMSGLTVINPHEVNFTPTSEGGTGGLASPPAMQFTDYFDIDTKLHVYVAMDDDLGLYKEWCCKGDGSTAVQGWRHHPANPRKATNGGAGVQTLPYGMNISLFRGQTEDGRCGHYDAAIRYREWATAVARPQMVRGPWVDSIDIPNRVKNSDFYYVVQAHINGPGPTFWTDMVEDTRRIKNFLGAAEMMMLWYGWGINQGALISPPTFRPPEFTPLPQLANEDTALGTAAAQGIHVSWYTIPGIWDVTLDGADDFNYLSFDGSQAYGPMDNYMVKDQHGVVPNSSGLTAFNLGVAALLASIKAIITDTHLYDATGVGFNPFGYYRQTTNKPRGWYYDLWGGS